MVFCHHNASEQEFEEGVKEETMLDSVAETCVPITAAVQSMALGHVPVKISKYSSCIVSSAFNMLLRWGAGALLMNCGAAPTSGLCASELVNRSASAS